MFMTMFIFLVAVGGGEGGKQARRRGGGSLQKGSFYGHKMGPKIMVWF